MLMTIAYISGSRGRGASESRLHYDGAIVLPRRVEHWRWWSIGAVRRHRVTFVSQAKDRVQDWTGSPEARCPLWQESALAKP